MDFFFLALTETFENQTDVTDVKYIIWTQGVHWI